MDEQDLQDSCICIERLLTASTVLIRYKNPVNPVYPCLNPDFRASGQDGGKGNY